MKYGLRESDLEYLTRVLSMFKEVKKAYIFGSRVKGNYKKGSDIDIAIEGKNINIDIVSRIKYELEELSSMPYFFDILDIKKINNDELLEHINRVGEVIYENRE